MWQPSAVVNTAGRSLDALRGYPRNAVPSAIVLDRQHRVAAGLLAAEPPPPPEQSRRRGYELHTAQA